LEQGTYTFKVWRLPEDKNEITVVIDAGHGGSERGAIGCLGDEEKNINLKIAEYTAEYLKNKDINVVMTRECDADMSLNDRVNYARENKADIFVSIHLNSIADIPMNVHKNRGTSVYYFNNNAKQLAEAIEENVTHYAKTRDDEVRTASFAVIRPTDYIGVLVETAYMTNPFDSVLYRNDKWLKKAAKGISEGILDFIKK
jgi:N-acetylmuramoyl-L-alanine amidase